jgi:hypothetical protein
MKGLPKTVVRTDMSVERIMESLIENGGNIGQACQLCGISRVTLAHWMAEDANIAPSIEAATRIGTQVLEDRAIDLAINGVDEPIVSYGKVVAWRKKMDTKILIALLQARKPEIYRTNVSITQNSAGTDARVINTLSQAASHITTLEERHGEPKKIAAPGKDAAVEFGLPALNTVTAPADDQGFS